MACVRFGWTTADTFDRLFYDPIVAAEPYGLVCDLQDATISH
jgi:hypothetical protein